MKASQAHISLVIEIRCEIYQNGELSLKFTLTLERLCFLIHTFTAKT